MSVGQIRDTALWKSSSKEIGKADVRSHPCHLHAGRGLAGSPGRPTAGEARPLLSRRLEERLDGRNTVVSRLLRSREVPAARSPPLLTFPEGEGFGMGRRLLRRPLAIALAGRVTLGRLGVCWVILLEDAPWLPVVCTVPSRG